MFTFVIFTDAFQAAANNRHSIKPVKLGIGNHPLSVLNKPHAKRVRVAACLRRSCACSHCHIFVQHLMFMPKIQLPDDRQDKKSSLQRELLHFALEHLLAPLAEAQKNGGFKAMYKGR